MSIRDYYKYVKKVKYDDNNKKNYIDKMKVVEDTDQMFSEVEKSKYTVIREINNGEYYATTYWEDGEYQHGEKIHVVETDSITYLRTDPDNQKRDNLGDLPTYE